MAITLPFTFSGQSTIGSGRGKKLGYPTVNLHLEDIPSDLEEGIFAGVVKLEEQNIPAVIHYGPRPVFDDTTAFEIHLINHSPTFVPETLEIQIIKRLRDVQDFPSQDALKAQIEMDIAEATRILDI